MSTDDRMMLQAVMKASDEQAAMFSAEAVAARRDATAAAMLPKLFDSVRAVFGTCGPNVMPTQKVCCQIYLPFHPCLKTEVLSI